jgi:DNA-directed RNA polymerase subunit N (RpoN/RPB10)
MIVPIRCFSCGKPIGHLWEEYQERIEKGESKDKALNALGLDKYCCRAQMLGNIELIDTTARFKKF